jgi:hypothetical protein
MEMGCAAPRFFPSLRRRSKRNQRLPLDFDCVPSFPVFVRHLARISCRVFFDFSFVSGTGGAAWRLSGLDVVNIAITTNARGGPGIVLASVAYDAGIINAAFYTTLVITAVVTSLITGAWLRFVLSKGWPLLSTNPDETWKFGETGSQPVLPQGAEGATV